MKNKGNILIVLLMSIIIVMLLALCILLATNTISFNVNSNKQNMGTQDNSNEEKNTYTINYKEEVYVTKNSKNVESTKSKRNIIKISNDKNEDAASSIETKLNLISDKQWEEIKNMADETKENTYQVVGVNYLFKTGIINDNRLTITASMDGDFGGVGWTSDEGYNFDAATGNLLKLNDIGTGVYDYLYNSSINELEKNNYTLIENWKEKVKEELNKDGNWYFTNNGMKINFPKYSITDGASGIITIDIAKEDINQYLFDKYKIK